MIDWIYWLVLYLYLAGGLTTVGGVVLYHKWMRHRGSRSSTLVLLYILWPWLVAVAVGWMIAESVTKCFRVNS